MDDKRRIVLPWTLTALVSALAVYVWGSSFRWQWHTLNAYLFFPVLGLLAYSILWSQYMTNAINDTLLKGSDLTNYFRYTGYAVLVAILLHPSILIYSLYRDGFGLPPGSYKFFVGPSRDWIVWLGTVSLLIFLAFELHRWFGQKPWWKYVISAGDVAMLAIFYHGLRLGNQLQAGWFVVVWWLYGITLVAALARKYTLILRHHSSANQTTGS